MARIRSIKPEFPQSESMGRVSRDARLLFINLWPICDDHGRTRASSRMLASLLFPYDDDALGLIEGWLDELEEESCIRRYSVGGSTYLHIPKWLIHQRIDKPSKAQHPAPPEYSPNAREDSESVPGRKGREGKGKEGKEAAPDGDLLAGLDPQVAKDFRALRTKLRAPITATAIAGIRREAGKAGLDLEAAITVCCERGWRGFKAEWLNGGHPAMPGQGNGAAPRKRVML